MVRVIFWSHMNVFTVSVKNNYLSKCLQFSLHQINLLFLYVAISGHIAKRVLIFYLKKIFNYLPFSDIRMHEKVHTPKRHNWMSQEEVVWRRTKKWREMSSWGKAISSIYLSYTFCVKHLFLWFICSINLYMKHQPDQSKGLNLN